MRRPQIVDSVQPGLVKAGALDQANVLGTVVRNVGFAFIALVYVAQTVHTNWGNVLAAVTFAWGAVRLSTLSLRHRWVVADGVLAVILCASEGALSVPANADPSMSFTRAVAEIVAVSVAISMPIRIAGPVVGSTILACLFGRWSIDGSLDPTVLYPLVDGCVAAAIRWGFTRAAFHADQLSEAVRVERLRSDVAAARRRFDRDQLALLHDTAASTLLMVGAGSAPNRERLARQAAHDVDLLEAAAKSVRNEAALDLWVSGSKPTEAAATASANRSSTGWITRVAKGASRVCRVPARRCV